MYVDLHVHTHHSDGVHSPSEVVAMAREKGLLAIAITDHDSVSGIDEASAAADHAAMEVIPGIEFSTEYGSFQDIHLLGYYIDYKDSLLKEKLIEFTNRRERRTADIISRINQKLAGEKRAGLTYAEVSALAGGSLGRPHIARTLISKGYARDMEDAFLRYLIPCNVPKLYFPVEEALREIRRLGGVAVLAHPTTITADRDRLWRLIRELAGIGLDGLEVFTNLCYKDDTAFLEGVAARLKLTITGGSDFHGAEGDNAIGTGRGCLSVPYELAIKLGSIAADRRGKN